MTKATVRQAINRELAEDGYHYTFEDLLDRWEAAYSEAIEEGDDTAWIKIPSGSEFNVRTVALGIALGR